jgi:hypothetical protein
VTCDLRHVAFVIAVRHVYVVMYMHLKSHVYVVPYLYLKSRICRESQSISAMRSPSAIILTHELEWQPRVL